MDGPVNATITQPKTARGAGLPIENMFGKLKDWPIVGKTVPRTVF